MALHYDYTIPAARLGDKLWREDGTMQHEYERVIWATLGVDIGHIKDEKDATEFLTRVRIAERLDDAKYPLPASAVFAMIGLKVNVAFEKRHVWLSRRAKRAAAIIELNAKSEALAVTNQTA